MQFEYPWIENSTLDIFAWNVSSVAVNISILNVSLHECNWNITGINMHIHSSNLSQMSLNSHKNINDTKMPWISVINSTLGFLNISSVHLHISDSHVDYDNSNGAKGIMVIKSNVGLYSSLFQRFNGRSGSEILITAISRNLEMINSTFLSNSADESIISTKKSNVTILHSTFIQNRIEKKSAVLYAMQESTLTITDSKFSDNKGNIGGAITVENKTVIMVYSSLFIHNSAVWGSAIAAQGHSNVYINGSTFIENHGFSKTPIYPSVGGAVLARSFVTLEIQNSSFIGNTAAYAGAVYLQWGSKLKIGTSSFESQHGESLNAQKQVPVTSETVSFVNNRADGPGGALFSSQSCTLTLENVMFEGNRAKVGGAVNIQMGVHTNISETTFVNNSVVRNYESTKDGGVGGAISATKHVRLNIHNSLFQSNIAAHAGGAIYAIDHVETVVDSSSFDSNKAVNGGALSSA